MGRYRQAPYGYECEYKDSCPHLRGISTTWAYNRYQDNFKEAERYWRLNGLFRDENEKLSKENELLRNQLAQTEAKLQALHRSQFKANKKSIKPSDASSLSGNVKKKKRGAKIGHPGWVRSKPKHIDQTINVNSPEACPYCSNKDLTSVDELKEHVQEDIVLIPKTVTVNYIHKQSYCSKCGCNVVDKGENEIIGSSIGPVAKSTAIYLRYHMGLSYRKVQRLFDELFGLKFVHSSALGFDRAATKRGLPAYNDLLEKIRTLPVAYADETSWRQNGINHQLWYVGNQSIAFFHIDRHRTSEVAQYLLGKDFSGGLVTDGFAGYNAVNAKSQQSCCSHLIRNAKDKKQELIMFKEKNILTDNKSEEFFNKIAKFFSDLCALGREKTKGLIKKKEVPAIKKKLERRLSAICKESLTYDTAESFRTRLLKLKQQQKLFTFLSYPGMDTTNNHSEQTIRFMVIFRKIIFGTRSSEGSLSHSVLPSLILTAQRQGVHPREYLQKLITLNTKHAQTALFNNST